MVWHMVYAREGTKQFTELYLFGHPVSEGVQLETVVPVFDQDPFNLLTNTNRQVHP